MVSDLLQSVSFIPGKLVVEDLQFAVKQVTRQILDVHTLESLLDQCGQLLYQQLLAGDGSVGGADNQAFIAIEQGVKNISMSRVGCQKRRRGLGYGRRQGLEERVGALVQVLDFAGVGKA